MNTKEIVVNHCFGGFGISKKAQLELFDRGCTHFKVMDEDDYFKDSSPIKTKEDRERHLEMCQIAHRRRKVYSDEHRDGDRTCKHLIALIKEWGSKRVSGRCAELEVVEIPEDVEYIINDNDGQERVEEKHRTW